jgi:hypothetical protein
MNWLRKIFKDNKELSGNGFDVTHTICYNWQLIEYRIKGRSFQKMLLSEINR